MTSDDNNGSGRKAAGKLRLVAVGTGRDGTQSLYHMVQDLLDASGGGTANHEYMARETYNAYCNFRETNAPEYLEELRAIVADCPYDAIIGNGYAPILRLFAETHGSGLKVIHLRRDRRACVSSLIKNAENFPTAYRYYSKSDAAEMKRFAAFHFGEMGRAGWDRLSIDDKFGWYYDKTHRLIDDSRDILPNQLVVSTERLDDEPTRRRLASFVVGSERHVPSRRWLNASVIDISTFPDRYRHKMHWLLGRLDREQLAENDLYALDYFLNKFIAWSGYQLHQSEQLGTAEPKSREEVIDILRQGQAIVADAMREINGLLAEAERRGDDESRDD